MKTVFIIYLVLLTGLVVFALCKIRKIGSQINDIHNKAFIMQGDIEANTARSKDNYRLIAKLNSELESTKSDVKYLHKMHVPGDVPAKEVEKELESLVPEQEEKELDDTDRSSQSAELQERREKFATYRKQGMDIKSAGAAIGVSYSTAKRYEKWVEKNKK